MPRDEEKRKKKSKKKHGHGSEDEGSSDDGSDRKHRHKHNHRHHGKDAKREKKKSTTGRSNRAEEEPNGRPPKKRSKHDSDDEAKPTRAKATISAVAAAATAAPGSPEKTRRSSKVPGAEADSDVPSLQNLIDAGIIEAGDKRFKIKFMDGEGRNAALVTKNGWVNDGYETYPSVASWISYLLSKKQLSPKLDEKLAWALVYLRDQNLADVGDAYLEHMKAVREKNRKKETDLSSVMEGHVRKNETAALLDKANEIILSLVPGSKVPPKPKPVSESDDDSTESEDSSAEDTEEYEEPDTPPQASVTATTPPAATVTTPAPPPPLPTEPAPTVQTKPISPTPPSSSRPILGFLDPSWPQLECPFCLFALENPVVLDCPSSHMVCEACAKKMFQRACFRDGIPQCCRPDLGQRPSALPPEEAAAAAAPPATVPIFCPACRREVRIPLDAGVASLRKRDLPADTLDLAARIVGSLPGCTAHSMDLRFIDTISGHVMCPRCAEDHRNPASGLLEINQYARLSLSASRDVCEKAEAACARFTDAADRLDAMLPAMQSTLQAEIAKVDRDADSLIAEINRRRKQLADSARGIVRERGELLHVQADALRHMAAVLAEDVATARAVTEARLDPFRMIRTMPLIRGAINEHSVDVIRSEPCVPVSLDYRPLRDGDVTGLAVWGHLRDLELSLERSNMYAELTGFLGQGKSCTATISIGPVRTVDGTEFACPPWLLQVIDISLLCQGERQPIATIGPWMSRKHPLDFGGTPKSHSRELRFVFSCPGEHMLVASIGESFRRIVSSFLVVGTKSRAPATGAPYKK